MYFKAGTNIVGVPKEMVFIDKKNQPHLLNTLTPKNHLATHYGTSAVGLTTKRGNLVRTVSKGEYVDYKKKVAKQKTAVKKAVKATTELVKAEEKMKKRGRPAGSKNKQKVVASTMDAIAVAMTPKKRGRPAGSGKKKV